MDAVINGLTAGVVAGLISYFSGFWEKMYSPTLVYTWLLLLSAISIGIFITTSIILSTFAASPVQTKQGVVQ